MGAFPGLLSHPAQSKAFPSCVRVCLSCKPAFGGAGGVAIDDLNCEGWVLTSVSSATAVSYRAGGEGVHLVVG